MGPRDTPAYGPRINYDTGKPLTDAQSIRLERLSDTADAFRAVMHECEGSSTDDGWDFRTARMQHAAAYLEVALMLARKVACEVP